MRIACSRRFCTSSRTWRSARTTRDFTRSWRRSRTRPNCAWRVILSCAGGAWEEAPGRRERRVRGTRRRVSRDPQPRVSNSDDRDLHSTRRPDVVPSEARSRASRAPSLVGARASRSSAWRGVGTASCVVTGGSWMSSPNSRRRLPRDANGETPPRARDARSRRRSYVA